MCPFHLPCWLRTYMKSENCNDAGQTIITVPAAPLVAKSGRVKEWPLRSPNHLQRRAAAGEVEGEGGGALVCRRQRKQFDFFCSFRRRRRRRRGKLRPGRNVRRQGRARGCGRGRRRSP